MKQLFLKNMVSSLRKSNLVVFSALYRESTGFLRAYIDNFLSHVETGILLVNLPSESYEKVIRSPEFSKWEVEPRVKLIQAHLARQAFGSGLLLAHLYNFTLARQTVEFDYFCTLASNELFFREFNLMECIQVMNREKKIPTVPVATDDRSGNWPMILGSQPLITFMAEQGFEKFCCNQIEGMIASVENWDKVALRRPLLEEIEANFADDKTRFPVEEVLPGTIIANEGDGRFTHICWNHWERVPCGGKVRFDDLLQLPNRRYSPQTVAVKWVDRDVLSPIAHTLIDTSMHERFRKIADFVNVTNSTDLIACHHLLDAAVRNVRERFQTIPLIGPPSFASKASFEFQGPIDRRHFPIWPKEQSLEFLFLEQFEKASARFTIGVTANCVAIDWHGGDLSSLPVDVWRHRRIAYFYVPLPELPLPAGTCLEFTVLRSRAAGDPSGNSDRAPGGKDNPVTLDALAFTNRYGRLVTHVNGRYDAVNLDHCACLENGSGWRLFFHLAEHIRNDAKQPAHIGLPVVAGDNVTFSLNGWIPNSAT